jgi:hypothetical protein
MQIDLMAIQAACVAYDNWQQGDDPIDGKGVEILLQAYEQYKAAHQPVELSEFLKWLDTELVCLNVIRGTTRYPNAASAPEDYLKGFGEACTSVGGSIEGLRESVKRKAQELKREFGGVILRKNFDGVCEVFIEIGGDKIQIIKDGHDIIDHWVNWQTVEELIARWKHERN